MISAHWCLSPNLGDALTPYLVQKFYGQDANFVQYNSDLEHFLLSGSILNWANEHAICWGLGLGSITDGVNPGADIRSVRGPLSRLRALMCGAKCPPIYGDSGLVLPKVYKPQPREHRYKMGIVPHYVDMYRVYEAYKGDPAISVIDMLKPIEEVIDAICACDSIISSALHGLVVAEAYGIPNAWAKFSDSLGGDGMKFHDHFASVKRTSMEEPPAFIDCRETVYHEMNWWNDRADMKLGSFNVNAIWDARPKI